ncbi:MAG: hypothetical protein ABH834_07315 [Candidatus Altiarchaeota archaeon]
MVSDDLAFNALKKEFDRTRALLEEEKKRTVDLENRIQEQEAQFTEQYQKLLKVEKGLVSGEETLHTIEQEKIKALSRHLAKEHNMRLAAEDAKDALEEDYKQRLADERVKREELLAEKDVEIESLKDTIAEKDEQIEEERRRVKKVEERELDTIINVATEPSPRERSSDELMGEEDANWLTETQDFVKILHRWGSIKLDEAVQTMDSDTETVREYARILKEKGLIKVDGIDGENPTFRATRDLVGKVNELRVKARRRGRIQ